MTNTAITDPIPTPALLWLLSEDGIPMSGEETSEFDAWVKRQTSDPYAAAMDPVVAFRLAKLATVS